MRQLTDSSGAPVMAQNYAPYGDVLESYGAESSNYGFAGEWTDGTGLQHLRARYLNTGIGRFVSRDSWGGDYRRPLSLNRWNYGISNPIMYVDPSGNRFCPQHDVPCTPDESKNGVVITEEGPEIQGIPGNIKAFLRCMGHPIVDMKEIWNIGQIGPDDAKVILKTNWVVFSADPGTGWSQSDMNGIKIAAQTVAHRLYVEANNNSKRGEIRFTAKEVWDEIFGGPVEFRRRSGSCSDLLEKTYPQYKGCKGGAFTNTRNEIWAFTDTPPGLFGQYYRIGIHELGHAFENAWEWHGYNKPRTELPSSMINPDGLRYRNGGDNSDGEIWADMFTGWVFDTWKLNAEGQIVDEGAKRNHMMDKMPYYIDTMLRN